MMCKRFLLIDDHALFRAGLVALFGLSAPSVQVVQAASIHEALQCTPIPPDVVLLDIALRGLNGIAGIELLKRAWPQVPIVMVSSDASPDTIQLALARGASAFVSKEKSAEEVLQTVQRVTGYATDDSDRPASQAPIAEDDAPTTEHLTHRQLEVLDLLCKGLPNKAIGRKLELSENTVRWHVQGILKFLQVSNRSEAAFAARARGFIG